MRLAPIAVIICCTAGAAFAQEPVVVTGVLAEAVKALPLDQPLTSAHVRKLNGAALSDGKLDAGEKAFLEKIALGQSFLVKAGGGQQQLAASPEAQHVAALLSRPADMGPMWMEPARIGDLVEFTRWAPVSRDRATRYVGGQLFLSFNQSTVFNGYAPFKTLLDQKWAAMKALPDPEAREAGRAMLFDAAMLARQESYTTATPMPDHLFAWLGSQETKTSIR
jgi:hypothetical protein